MTFKGRLTLAAAIAVAVAVALASFAAYVIVRRQLISQVDGELMQLAERSRFIEGPGQIGYDLELPEATLGGPQGYAQLVGMQGSTLRSGSVQLPVDGRTIGVARGTEPEFYSDMRVEGVHIRVLTTQVVPGVAVQLARPLDEVDDVLKQLRWILLLITGCGIALAVGLGGGVTRAAMAPIRKLTEASEHVTTTSDLSTRIEVEGNDEISRLAGSFNAMLDALDASLSSQRQLVADASHELRTPITSMRTNIEVLARSESLPEDERERLKSDVIDQLDELTLLIGDIVELARGVEPDLMTEEVRLDELVDEAVGRARKRGTGHDFQVATTPALVQGVPGRLDRALNNLLDNATKWSPSGTVIEVVQTGGEISVRDHGPGIDPVDLPYVFDRFYRAKDSRGTAGSGLGLAIVRQVAASHGGSVTAENAADGGALFKLSLPAEDLSDVPAPEIPGPPAEIGS